jgi:hypothetical protein
MAAFGPVAHRRRPLRGQWRRVASRDGTRAGIVYARRPAHGRIVAATASGALPYSVFLRRLAGD